MVAHCRRRTGVGTAVYGAGHHTAHIGVHHRHPLTIGEAGHGTSIEKVGKELREMMTFLKKKKKEEGVPEEQAVTA